MKKDTHFHILHYLVLIVILLSAVVAFFALAGNHRMQFQVAIMTSFIYFLWGVVHHHLEGDLHPKIVVEYLLVALLAVFLLQGTIFR
ncbi:hypothetical protein HY029_03410 [Candidatus Gottesmanbacteria bacterium]|nr:hypothetical protein [Candidatus Gottesmanbacteria bacterium]